MVLQVYLKLCETWPVREENGAVGGEDRISGGVKYGGGEAYVFFVDSEENGLTVAENLY